MLSNSPILEVVDLHKQYSSTSHGILAAISNISFEVAQGEFLCIVGPSGCGKTTILRLLAGLIKPDGGQIRFNKTLLQNPRDEIGLVFQKANLMPWRTVFDNVLLPLQIQHINLDKAKRQVQQALTLVGLAEFEQAYPRELSGGMQQRVAIARALVHEPEVLLLDEPFAALDALTRERLNLELMRLWEGNRKTVVMVTHNIREAVFLAERVLVLSQRPGQIVSEIPINLPHPRHVSLFYEADFGALAYQVRQAIEINGKKGKKV